MFIDKLWDDFNYGGFIECPISGYKFYKDKLNDMTPQKLFNYLLQHLETATNIEILWDIHKLLRGKKTKIVLYVYDSFLFDLDKKEKNLLLEVQQIFESRKLNIKIAQGADYSFSLEN
jgi:formyltetrahydrofolate synthetase